MEITLNSTMKNWMQILASHFENVRCQYQNDNLLILFDIDGTIIDMRYMVRHVLQNFDYAYGTHFFHRLRISDITVHENHIKSLLKQLRIALPIQEEILTWYINHRWTLPVILESHHPFCCVFEVIRWFQLQPNTFVGLNTGRPNKLRSDTLYSLNKLGKEYQVQFSDNLLNMNHLGWEQGVKNSKAVGVQHFRQTGYHVFAVIDNEPDNLAAISEIDPYQDILLLHANTIFESKLSSMPPYVVSGNIYDLGAFPKKKPGRVGKRAPLSLT